MQSRSILLLLASTLVLACSSDKGNDTSAEEADADTDTDTDTDTDVEPVCGDGITNGDEECDDSGASATCDEDCTLPVCGDGLVNAAAGEACEPTTSEPWDRCALCVLGAGLDGSFGKTWEVLTPPDEKILFDNMAGLQSFHYQGQAFLYDFTTNLRYDIAKDTWTPLGTPAPVGSAYYWVNGAVDSASIWVPRDTVMHRFDLLSETWSTGKGKDLPDGADQEGAAVFDGEGFIWYHGPSDTLVRYSPADGLTAAYSHDSFDAYETRMAYDPATNRIAFTGYSNDRFLIFDIGTETFSEGSASPGGEVHDNTCQDRSGGIYTGSGDYTTMYRYDIALDTWTALPLLPIIHDNNSSCVVSQEGYLYYPTWEKDPAFFRLPLGTL